MSENNSTGICTRCGAEKRPRLNRKKGESAFRPCLPCQRIWKENYEINGPQPTNICRECGAEKEAGKPCVPCKKKRRAEYWDRTYVKSTRESRLDYLKSIVFGVEITSDKHWSEYPCLKWPFGKDKDGYGKVKVDLKGCRAHRVAFELVFGKIPDDMRACHYCDNPSCISPPHLFIGTDLDNVRDKIAKGRARYAPARGERAGSAKLTVAQVLEIRDLKKQGLKQREIGRRFDISGMTVSTIHRGTTWAHVPDERAQAADSLTGSLTSDSASSPGASGERPTPPQLRNPPAVPGEQFPNAPVSSE